MSVKLALIFGLLWVNVMAYAAPVQTVNVPLQTDKLAFSVGVFYDNSNNIGHSSVVKVDENIIHTLLTANYEKRSARINANFSLNADHQDYQKQTFSDQTVISSDFKLGATMEKNRLFWDVYNRMNRVQINQALPNIPTNQENSNYFMAGPRVVFFKNNKDSLNADLRYENFYTETSNSDYSGYIFDASYLRNITRTATAGLVIKYTGRKYDNQILNANFKRTDVTLNLSKRMKLSTLQIDVGKTQLNYQNLPNTQDGIFRAVYQYRLGKKTSLNASYSRELSDFSNIFATTASGSTTYANVSGAIFVLKLAELSIRRNFSNSSLVYDYVYSSNDYSDNTLDIISRVSTISLNNKLSFGLNLNLSAIYRDTSYLAGNRVDVSRRYMFGLVRTFQNSYDLELNVQYTNNGSSDNTFSYDERRVSVGGHYYFR